MAQRSMDTIKNTIAKIVRNVIVFVVLKIVGGGLSDSLPLLFSTILLMLKSLCPCPALLFLSTAN